MNLPIRRFLERQLEEALRLGEESDLVDIVLVGTRPVQRYVVRLHTRGLVQTGAGNVQKAEGCAFGIFFAAEYLWRVDPFEAVQWIGPQEAHHPNIGRIFDGRTAICTGPLLPGTPLVDLIDQVREIWGFVKAMPAEHDALNRAACQWARRNAHRFPIDSRPLRRGVASVDLSRLEVEEVTDA